MLSSRSVEWLPKRRVLENNQSQRRDQRLQTLLRSKISSKPWRYHLLCRFGRVVLANDTKQLISHYHHGILAFWSQKFSEKINRLAGKASSGFDPANQARQEKTGNLDLQGRAILHLLYYPDQRDTQSREDDKVAGVTVVTGARFENIAGNGVAAFYSGPI